MPKNEVRFYFNESEVNDRNDCILNPKMALPLVGKFGPLDKVRVNIASFLEFLLKIAYFYQ